MRDPGNEVEITLRARNSPVDIDIASEKNQNNKIK